MTINNLEAIVSPSSEDLLLIRHGGKDYRYPLSTLASNLVNNPTISSSTLGTTTHPFTTANITTLNVGGSGTVNGNLTVQAAADSTSAASLKVGQTLTVKGDATINGTLAAGSADITNDLKVDTLEGINGRNIPRITISDTLSLNELTAENSTLTVAGKSALTTTSLNLGSSSSLSVTNALSLKELNAENSTLTVTEGDIGGWFNDPTGAARGTTLSNAENLSTVDISEYLRIKSLTAPNSHLTVSSGDVTTETLSLFGSEPSIEVASSLKANSLTMSSGTLTVGSSGTVTVGSTSTEQATIDDKGKLTLNNTNSFTDTDVENGTTDGKCALYSKGSIISDSFILGGKVFNAVWNDLADCIPINEEAIIEPGYCYCFNGEKYYRSTKYLEKGIIGIESDTYGMHMGSKPGIKQMDVAVSGFALAYVDKEYESGTPLTCMEGGYLTEIAKQDKIEYPERIVGTYWKPEPNEEWGSSDRKVKVNGRHWVKIK